MICNAPHTALIVPGARLGSGQLELEPEPEPSQSGISISSARPSLARLMKALGSAWQADRLANTGSATASSGSGSRQNTIWDMLTKVQSGECVMGDCKIGACEDVEGGIARKREVA